MKGTGNAGSQFIRVILLCLLMAGVLAGCGGLRSDFDMATTLNVLGGGKHVTTFVFPIKLETRIFDALPDLSLLTGVQVEDYWEEDARGLRVTQTFARLSHLNADPNRAYVLNNVLPQTLTSFKAHWSPGFLRRQLHIEIGIAPLLKNGLFEMTALITKDLLNATFTLTLPGEIVAHNGQLAGEGVVVWTLDPLETQTLEATASVVNVPMIASSIFTLFACVWLIGDAALNAGRGDRALPRAGEAKPLAKPTRSGGASRSRRPLPPPRR
jgi:hypothetical protein